jgi:FkbM family methyltransferase
MNNFTRSMAAVMPYGLVRRYLSRRAEKVRSAAQSKLYSRLVTPGCLVFDVGANVGNRVDSYLALGCRVVAVEPQPYCMGVLSKKFSATGSVHLVQAGVGSGPGKLKLKLSCNGDTFASFSDRFVEKMKATERFGENARWTKEIEVDIVTLDSLVEKHGVPEFVKIDVEGFESEVLAGLNRAPLGLSFEYTPDLPENMIACIRHCTRLGLNYFQFSFGEGMRLFRKTSIGADQAEQLVHMLSEEEILFGDIYATKQPMER